MRIYLALVLVLWLAAGCDQASQQSFVSVFGSAVPVDIVTGDPIWTGDLSGTVVTIEGTNFSSVTTADGRFVINDVPAGVYSFSYARTGFGLQRILDFEVKENNVAQIAYLYPLNEYQAEITSISLEDTTITKTMRVGVVVATNGDTLDFGRDTVVTTFYDDDAISVVGRIRTKGVPMFFKPCVYIFLSKTATIDPLDTASWKELWSSELVAHQMNVTDSTFELKVRNAPYLRNIFRKGDNVFWAAYAAPWCYATNGLDGRTAHLMLKNKTHFPTFLNSSSTTVPFIFPW